MRRHAAIVIGLLATACDGSTHAPPTSGAPNRANTALAADAVVLPAETIPSILGQCSRQAPEAGERSWQPQAADIASLEAATATALQARRGADDPDWSAFPQGWRRQYVGIVRGGRRFIYGNFYPRDLDEHAGDAAAWRRTPTLVCDGGPDFFGVEYDVAASRITQLAFNGLTIRSVLTPS